MEEAVLQCVFMGIVAYSGEWPPFAAPHASASIIIGGWQTAFFTPMVSGTSLPLTPELTYNEITGTESWHQEIHCFLHHLEAPGLTEWWNVILWKSPFFFILICILYLSIVDLQCCTSFKCTAESLLSVLIDPFFFRVFSRVGYFRMLSRVPPCPLQWIVKLTQSCPTLCDPMDCSPWSSPGQNTWVGSLSLLQGIFPTQGSNPGLLHCSRLFTC